MDRYKKHGCGLFTINGSNQYAHKISYHNFNNAVANSQKVIPIVCNNKLCVNPIHLCAVDKFLDKKAKCFICQERSIQITDKCLRCYSRCKNRKKLKVPATCHPTRTAHVKNLCRECHADNNPNITRATCHQEKAEYSQGLCFKCYNQSTKVKQSRIKSECLRLYGITKETYDIMLEEQNNKCAICQNPAKHLDHDHKTGKIRAFLCVLCNFGLGNFQDNIQNIQNAIQYLKTHDLQNL